MQYFHRTKMARIRRATVGDAAAIASVHVDSWLTTYRGIVPNAYLDTIETAEWTERQRRSLRCPDDRVVFLVAEVQGKVIGWAVGGPERGVDPAYDAELYAIYLLLDYQRQGIGLRLTAAVAAGLLEAGMSSLLLWVLAENRSARRFYEALGGRYVREQQITIGGVSLPLTVRNSSLPARWH